MDSLPKDGRRQPTYLETSMTKEAHEQKQHAIAQLNRMVKHNHGKITPKMVVDAARDDDSALHNYFEWDDGVAAENYRMMQARTLLRSAYHKVTTETISFNVVKYVRDPRADFCEQGYIEVTQLKTQEDLAREALLWEFKRVQSLLKRARGYAKYFEMEFLVDELEEHLGIARSRIEDAPINSRAA